VPLKIPFYIVLVRNVILFLAIFLSIPLVFEIRPYLIKPELWLFIAISSYFICLSGIVYNIIHNYPVFRFDQDQYGKMYVKEYFMRSQRGQYGGEGYLASGVALMIGGCFLLISKISTLLSNPMHQRMAVGVLCCFTFVLVNVYVTFYRFKHPWYSNSFLPPQSFTKGPMWRDQGNNI